MVDKQPSRLAENAAALERERFQLEALKTRAQILNRRIVMGLVLLFLAMLLLLLTLVVSDVRERLQADTAAVQERAELQAHALEERTAARQDATRLQMLELVSSVPSKIAKDIASPLATLMGLEGKSKKDLVDVVHKGAGALSELGNTAANLWRAVFGTNSGEVGETTPPLSTQPVNVDVTVRNLTCEGDPRSRGCSTQCWDNGAPDHDEVRSDGLFDSYTACGCRQPNYCR